MIELCSPNTHANTGMCIAQICLYWVQEAEDNESLPSQFTIHTWFMCIRTMTNIGNESQNTPGSINSLIPGRFEIKFI